MGMDGLCRARAVANVGATGVPPAVCENAEEAFADGIICTGM
jgi:hypothetical protein